MDADQPCNEMMKLADIIDSFNETIGVAVSWLTGILVITVCYDVFTRYVVNASSVAVQELEWHLFAVIFLAGSAYTLKTDKHVRIDIVYQKLPERGKATVNFIGTILFLVPFAVLVIWTSKDFVLNSFAIHESSPDPGGLPARYLLKALIPLSFVPLLLQGLVLIFKSYMALIGGDVTRENRDD